MIFDCPLLWTNISVDLPSDQLSTFPAIPVALKLALDKARDHPLTLSVEFTNGYADTLPPPVEELLLNAVSQSKEIQVTIRILEAINWASPSLSLHRLETVKVMEPYYYASADKLRPILLRATALKSLVAPSTSQWFSNSLPLSSSMESLECEYSTDVSLFRSYFPHLTSLTLHLTHRIDRTPSNLEFPSLIFLKLDIFPISKSDVMKLLDGFVALPSLTSFTLKVYGWGSGLDSSIANFIQRLGFGPRLTSLTIDLPRVFFSLPNNADSDGEWFLGLILLLPALTSISLEFLAPSSSFNYIADMIVRTLQALLEADESDLRPHILPFLTDLSIRTHYEYERFPDEIEDTELAAGSMVDHLLALLELRATNHVPLQRAELVLKTRMMPSKAMESRDDDKSSQEI
ncbi:hypothetical protein AAF712_013895 [Marasmius tenuissimus]|uniref:Uncharacterized protein n=1 Tax=Marasmius tenuissimus TaxID=585030 RepID=A0ABR2ZDN6_9AGAR